MIKSKADHYGSTFYENQVDESLTSANIVLKIVFDIFKPQSLLDIGCGRGAWLCVAERLGVSTLHGIDGPWVKQLDLLSSRIEFQQADMEVAIPVRRRYEMAMSVEVAEHLSPDSAPKFVAALCSAADVVVFGAAVQCQGGENHINEQRQSYWVKLFQQNDYVHFDIIRPKLWLNKSVSPWYRQNTLIYINKNRVDLINLFDAEKPEAIIDLIHPEMFENRVNYQRGTINRPTLRLILGLLRSYIFQRVSGKPR